jgi:hypothetical protein
MRMQILTISSLLDDVAVLFSADKIVNLCILGIVAATMVNVGMGVHQLANGYGKKEGF